MPTKWAIRTAMALPMLCGAYFMLDWSLWSAGNAEGSRVLAYFLLWATPAVVLLFGAAATALGWTSQWVWWAVLVAGAWLVAFEALVIDASGDWRSLPLAISTGGYSVLLAAAVLWSGRRPVRSAEEDEAP
jgi:hypothetical protein